jgi:hypothetical protein
MYRKNNSALRFAGILPLPAARTLDAFFAAKKTRTMRTSRSALRCPQLYQENYPAFTRTFTLVVPPLSDLEGMVHTRPPRPVSPSVCVKRFVSKSDRGWSLASLVARSSGTQIKSTLCKPLLPLVAGFGRIEFSFPRAMDARAGRKKPQTRRSEGEKQIP